VSRLRVHHLRLRVLTDHGMFGADVPFTDGLNVLDAPNSRGKSICTQSILYALGMEAMLGPRHDVPLPDAMTKELSTDAGTVVSVQESQVLLEISGVQGRPVTLGRWAKHPTVDTRLVSVWDGPALADGGMYAQHDHLVRQEGVLDREVGLHHFLAGLVGWEAPQIVVRTGGTRPLYLEYLFALLFVEQRGGWAGIQALKPQFFLPEAEQRAVEFLLEIDRYERQRHRLQLTHRLADLGRQWLTALAGFRPRLRGTGLVLSGIPAQATASWPPETEPGVLSANGESTLGAQIGVLTEQLQQAEQALKRPTGADDEATARQLDQAEHDLLVLTAATRRLADDVAREQDTQRALGTTVAALEADLQRNTDAQRIRRLGSETWTQAEPDCPTCHRPLGDVLLTSQAKPPMTLDENIAYLIAEINTFKALRESSRNALELAEENLAAHRRQVNALRRQIRAYTTTLTTAAGTPSAAAIQQQLETHARLEELRTLEAAFADLLDDLRRLAAELGKTQARLAQSPDVDLTRRDHGKLADLQRLVVQQARDYGFRSFNPAEIAISDLTYRPSRNGADVGFGISASDGIRLIWAYLLGLLEVARHTDTNHPGFVIFDEPRQQSADPISLDAFLARASVAKEHGQQVLLATSEETNLLDPALEGLAHHRVSLDGWLLRPVAETTGRAEPLS
jgi:hypothetical protein